MERQNNNDVLKQLEEGVQSIFQSGKYQNYLNTLSKFTKYSTKNTILITMQKPDATFVAGYRAWEKNFERHVKKGEEAIKIFAPCIKKKYVLQDILDEKGNIVLAADGTPVREKKEVGVPGYKIVNVYDIKQTEGKELPTLAKKLEGTVAGYEKLEKALVKFAPVPIVYEKISNGANGYYDCETKKIVINTGMSNVQNVKTAVHEIAHALLHDGEDDMTRGEREVQAESIAYVVCQRYGIDTSEYSWGYIAAWSAGKDVMELQNSMDTIRHTADVIITGIDKELKGMEVHMAIENNSGEIEKSIGNAKTYTEPSPIELGKYSAQKENCGRCL